MSNEPSQFERGPRLVVLAALVALQAVGLVGLAVFLVIETQVATTSDVGRALVAALLALVCGLGLGLVARGLWHGRRWARSPALVTELLVAPVAVGLVQGGRWYVGVPLLVWAAAVLVLLFSRSVSAVLED
jgi:hypothetical protein